MRARAFSLSRGVAAPRAVCNAAGIARPVLFVTARWASEGRGAGATSSAAVAGKAKRVAQENPVPLRAAAGSERSSASTSRAAAAAELQGGPAEAAAEPEAGAPSSPLSAHISPPQSATARPNAAKAPAGEVAAAAKHAAAAVVPPSSAAAGRRGLDGADAMDAAAGAGSAVASAGSAAAASGAPAGSAVLQLYVQREGDPAWAEMSVDGGATVAGLTKEVVRELQLQGPLSAISLHVAKVDADTGALLRVEEAALPSRKALTSLPALQSGASIVVKVAAAPAAAPRLVADSTLFPSLPAPIEFQQQEGLLDATGAKVRVAQLLATGPYFLEDLAHQKLMSWARGHPGPAAADHKLLVLTGPIKSGKSTMLNDVLPGVLAAQHAAAGGPKPVFFHFSFTLGMGPRAAALKMAQDAGTFAKDLGFEINGVPATEELALTNLPSVIRSLAAGIAKGGGELVVLVDEAQAPIIATQASDDARVLASSLKEINTAIRAIARLAITGSGMIALLNTLRTIAPNGYTLWGAMARVHLGATPPPPSAAAMAADIIGFRRVSAKWPQDVADLVTPEYVLQLLSAGDGASHLTAPRPALVAYMADLMGKADVGAAPAVAEMAFKELQDKLSEEAKVDAAVALADLNELQRAQTYCLATGDMQRSKLAAALNLAQESKFMDLLNTVCQPSSGSGDDSLQLLPPYPVLFSAILDPSGKLLVEWLGKQWRLHELLSNRLKFFGEHSVEVMKRCGPAISAAVLDTLAANGIGVPLPSGSEPSFRAPATVNELKQVPSVAAIFDILNTQEATKKQCDEALSKSVRKFQDLAGRQAGDAYAAEFLANAGVHILLWLRHIEAHAYIPKTALVDSGLRVGLVDRVADVAVRTWEASGNAVKDGLPLLPIRGPLAAAL